MATKRFKPKGLLAKVDEHITSPLSLDSRAKHFYPTGASCLGTDGELRGSCLRQVALDYMDVARSNPYSADTMYTFGMGKHIELMFVEWFKEMGIFAGHNIKFYNPDFNVSGELDLVLREAPGSDELFGVELKSFYGPYALMEVVTGRKDHQPRPKDEHIMQVMMYLDNFPSLSYFMLIYVGRDKFDRIEYAIRLKEIDGDFYPEVTRPDGSSFTDMNFSIAKIYNRYKDLKNYLKTKQLPPRDYRPTMTQEEMQADLDAGKITKNKMKSFERGEILTADWRCRYCSFKESCRLMPEGAITNFTERFKAGEWSSTVREFDPEA